MQDTTYNVSMCPYMYMYVALYAYAGNVDLDYVHILRARQLHEVCLWSLSLSRSFWIVRSAHHHFLQHYSLLTYTVHVLTKYYNIY